MITKNKIKINKKKAIPILLITIILLLVGANFAGITLATLYGGDEENKYGGNVTISETGLTGETITSFASIPASRIDFAITNNANSPYSIAETVTVKRKAITMTSVTDLTEYQKMVTIPYTLGMGTDFEHIEIRNGDTVLPIWIEDYTASTSANVWVCGDFSTGDTQLHVYYGDDIATVNDPDNVFLEFDQFDTLSEWTVSADKGVMSISSDYVDSGISSAKRTGMQVMERGDCNYDNAIYEIKMYQTASTGLDAVFRRGYDSTGMFVGAEYGYTTTNYYFRNVGVKYNTGISQSIGWHDLKFVADGTYLNGYIDGTKVSSDIPYTTINEVVAFGDYWATFGCTVYFDTFKVRKYTSTEPTYVIGSEEPVFDGTISFSKQQIITIDNTGNSAITNYDYPFTLTYDSDMQPDMDDLWFTEMDGTHISHFKGVYTDSVSAKIYINIDCPSDSTKQIIMYYGNPYAPDLSDPESMFTIFEGFDTAIDVNDWYINIGNSDSYIIDESKMTLVMNDADEKVAFLDSKTLFDSPVIVESYFKPSLIGGTTGTTASRFGFAFHSTSQLYWNLNDAYDGYCSIFAWRGDSPNDVVNSISPNAITQNNVNYMNQWIEMSTIYKSNDMLMKINDESASICTDSLTNGYVGLHYFTTLSCTGTQTAIFDYIIVRPYIASEPSISFGNEITLANPSITVSCTGDSNSQQYGAETKEFTLYPTSDIDNFVIDGSANYDFDATIYYSGNTNVVENATAGTMNITFTPDITIEEGYANGVFTGNLTFVNYTISATLDDIEFTNVTLTNNTISAKLINCDTSEHIINIAITENETEQTDPEPETPTVPSSSGGGGSTYTPTVEELNETETESIPQTSEQLDKEEVNDLINDNFQSIMILVLFIAVGFLAIAFYKGRK